MASNLRKRLSKRTAFPDHKSTASDGDSSRNYDQPIARDDLSRTPPPPSERKSGPRNSTYARNTSPTQSLLFRYKNRSAPKQVMTGSPLKATETASARSSGRNGVSNKQLDAADPLSGPESMNVQSASENEPLKETRVFDGIEFEMMRTKKSGEALSDRARNEEATSDVPRQTRSQTRRQQRADLTRPHIELENLEADRGLTIRKVRETERTPSPLALKNDDDNTAGTGLAIPTSAPSNGGSPFLTAPSSPTEIDSATSEASPSYIPTKSISSISKLSSYRRSQQAKSPMQRDSLAMSVIPPVIDTTVPAGYLWVSHLGSSSRPNEPWGWMKKWTCCQCAVLDPRGRGTPGETMVEQKVCARLECGHERCPLGCRILRDQKFDMPSVFA